MLEADYLNSQIVHQPTGMESNGKDGFFFLIQIKRLKSFKAWENNAVSYAEGSCGSWTH